MNLRRPMWDERSRSCLIQRNSVADFGLCSFSSSMQAEAAETGSFSERDDARLSSKPKTGCKFIGTHAEYDKVNAAVVDQFNGG